MENLNKNEYQKHQENIDKRTKRETDKMLYHIKQAKEMKKLEPGVDKTPASVTKYKSGGGKSYQVKLDQKPEMLQRNQL